MNITLRPVENTDVSALLSISKATFLETYAGVNTQATMSEYVAETFTQSAVHQELTNPGSQFFFAELEGTVVGYLKLNRGAVQTDTLLENALEIERIYALAAYHGKGVGQALYAKAKEIAHADNFHWLWLGVWSKNPRAIRFYEKNGFTAFDTHTFKLGNDLQDDVLMRKKIEPNGLGS